MRGGAAPDHQGHLPWVKVELHATWDFVARCIERSDEGVSASEAEVFRGRDLSRHGSGDKDLPGIAEKVLRSIQRVVEGKGLELSITQGLKEGKAGVIASCSNFEEKFQECSKREGMCVATSVETQGLDLRTTTQQSGAKEEVRFEILAGQKKSRFSDEFCNDWCEEAIEDGLVFARVWRGTAIGIAPILRLK